MRKEERERRQLVVYEAYMAGQARAERTEEIVEALAEKFHVCPRTIQNWIYRVRKNREAQRETLRSNMMQLRHELGLPAVYTYMKDGHWVMEF